jgi:hypothetical protein
MSSGDDGWVTRFYPKGLRFLTFSKFVPLWNGQMFQACLSCGHVWSKVDTAELNALIEKSGNEKTSMLLSQGQSGVEK